MVLTFILQSSFLEFFLQGDPLAPYLLILALGYALQTAINDTDVSLRLVELDTLLNTYDLDYADNCLLADTLHDAETLLH